LEKWRAEGNCLMASHKVTRIRLEVIRLNPSDIVGYQSPEQQREIDKMASQLKKEGQREPIRLFDDYMIADGHIRFYAAKKNGLEGNRRNNNFRQAGCSDALTPFLLIFWPNLSKLS
jgi:hypothetical protein